MDVTFSTRRLTLRQPRPDDAPRLARLLNNFAVSGNLARVPYPYHEADAAAWLANWRPDRPPAETGFSLELPGEGLIGHCGYHLNDGIPVIGYWLGEPFWNRGFMSEAAVAVIDWYFEATPAATIASGVFHFNKASLAIQKKLGFAETGSGLLHSLARKEEVRHIDTLLTRAHWAERSNRARDTVPSSLPARVRDHQD
jgi:RimJ/RimL family protein N-acetyltransferase